MSLNKVMLIGNVGKDPSVRYLESNPQSPQANAKVASFPLATSERYRDRNGEVHENTEWHNIVAWRGNADVCEKYVHKGTKLFIEGRLRTRNYTGQDGVQRYTTEIVVDTLELLDRRQEGQDGQGAYQAQPAQPQAAPQQRVQPQPSQSPYQNPVQPAAGTDAPTDDLPF